MTIASGRNPSGRPLRKLDSGHPIHVCSMLEFLTDGGKVATLPDKPCGCHVRRRATASNRSAHLPVFPLVTLGGILLRDARSQLQQILEHAIPERCTQTD